MEDRHEVQIHLGLHKARLAVRLRSSLLVGCAEAIVLQQVQDILHDTGHGFRWLGDGSLGTINTSLRDIELIGREQFGKLVLPAQRSSTSLFYLSLVITTMILAFVIFLCPESREPTPVPDHEESTFRVDDNYRATSFPNFRLTLKRLSAALVSPIAMFAPRVAPGRTKKDYNLTFLGLGLFIYLISIVRTATVRPPLWLTECPYLAGRIPKQIYVCAAHLLVDNYTGTSILRYPPVTAT